MQRRIALDVRGMDEDPSEGVEMIRSLPPVEHETNNA
jgi:hypothetical protein